MTSPHIARMVTTWNQGDQDSFEERAAIHEFEAGMTTEDAERKAFRSMSQEIMNRWRLERQTPNANLD